MSPARARSISGVLQERAPGRPPLLVDGMIARRASRPTPSLASDWLEIYGRKKRGDARISDQPSARKPAVTFVLKF